MRYKNAVPKIRFTSPGGYAVPLIIALATLSARDAEARTWREVQIPNGNQFSCTACHVNPYPSGPANGQRNSFGLQVGLFVTPGGGRDVLAAGLQSGRGWGRLDQRAGTAGSAGSLCGRLQRPPSPARRSGVRFQSGRCRRYAARRVLPRPFNHAEPESHTLADHNGLPPADNLSDSDRQPDPPTLRHAFGFAHADPDPGLQPERSGG